jgi:hypothetical protein
MEQAPGGFALVGRAVAVGLDFGADCTADTEVRVPESDVAGSCTGNVYLDLLQLVVTSKTAENYLPICTPEEHRPL